MYKDTAEHKGTVDMRKGKDKLTMVMFYLKKKKRSCFIKHIGQHRIIFGQQEKKFCEPECVLFLKSDHKWFDTRD